MFFSGRKKYWLTAATIVPLAAVLFLLAPAFRNAAPPETVGADVIIPASGFSGDFEGVEVAAGQPAAGEHLALAAERSQGSFTSEPVRSDYPFNALGLHWVADVPEGASVAAEVRFSQDGSQWGQWHEVMVSDEDLPDHVGQTKSAGEAIGQLVFTDEAGFFQYRFTLSQNQAAQSPAINRLTASYIDAKGYHESPLSVAGIFNRVAAIVDPPVASAQPGVITRAQWGANEAYMTWDPEYASPKKQIVHHTVTSNSDPDPAATVRSIYYYHAVSLGWGDIGYNYLIDQQGRIYEGRYGGNGVVGGHALGWNTGTIGISALGNYEQSGITPAMYSAFVELMSWKSNQNQIDPNGSDLLNGVYKPNYMGHRDSYSTACPGGNLYAYLPAFRSEAAARYSPYPIIGAIGVKWNNLNGAPGAALGVEYAVAGGMAQDFRLGRIYWNSATGATYWVYGSILARYDQMGREGGALGWPASDEYAVGAGRANNFASGRIYWSSATGARSVQGAILTKLLAEGDVTRTGFPVTDEYDTAGVTGGRVSDFQYTRIYWSAGTGAHSVYGAILASYLAQGGPASALGLPTTDETGITGGRQSLFAGGAITWSAATGARTMKGQIYTKYQALGGTSGPYGLPASDEYAASSGSAQNLQSGIITSGSVVGTHIVYGGIMNRWLQRGGPGGGFGLAATDEIDAPGVAGARESDFERGRIYWSASTGVREVYGLILAKYVEKGASATFGVPVTDEYDIAGVPGGRASNFQGANIYFHATTGAWEVHGGILGLYLAYGGPAGGLGLPVTDEFDVAGVTGARESDFQRGRIYWSAATSSHSVYGAILQKYLEYGGPASPLGLPTSEEYAYGSGRRTDFQGGYVYWTPSNGAQVFTGGNIGGATVTADSTFEIRSGTGALVTTLAAGQTATVTYLGGVYSLQTSTGFSHQGSSWYRMTPTSGSGIMQVTSYHDVPSWNPSLDDNRFRGTIEVRYSAVSNTTWVINELPLESYLRGIAETSSGSPAEFLKTMTVAGRSYALYHVDRGGKYYGSSQDIFHLKNSRNGNGDDQLYKGYGLEARFPDLVGAVNATAGQVITYGGSPVIATYFSNTDGATRSAQQAWGTSSWPWLAAVPDPDCAGMSMNGHGVGLSGYGALARANRGDSYQAILTYYYTGVAVQAVDTNRNIRVAITRLS